MCVVFAGVGVARAQSSLPSPWGNRDIGNPAASGSASQSSGTITIDGGGADVWGTADQFHFAYQSVSGDVDVAVRVTSIEAVDRWTKAGVMIREGLGANARHAFMLVSSGRGYAFQRRPATGGMSYHTDGGSGTAPGWVRLVRQGTTFRAYRSSNGSSWTQVGSATISMASTAYVGLAVTSHQPSASATATFANFSSSGSGSGSTLPAPWVNQDIGGAATPGTATLSNNTFSVAAAGAQIWGTSDQFHYVYQPMQGDAEIVARVASVQQIHAQSKAGVMIRNSLSPSAAYAFMAVSAGSGWGFQRRLTDGGISYFTAGRAGTSARPPGWVKVVREGNLFSAYESTDGNTWTLVESDTIAMSGTVYIGLAVMSHLNSQATTATLTNVTVGGPSGNEPPGNQPPTVSITSPAQGATFSPGATVTVGATAADTDGSIARVEFYVGSQLIRSDTSSPYTATWTATSGSHALTAVATDNGGARTTSSAVSITVGTPQNQAPTVSITSPASGANFSAPATIAVSASASDPDGSVTRVDFYEGQNHIGSDTTSPFSITSTNVPAGSYSVRAVATDNDGATTSSASVPVTVGTQQNQLPTVAITSPASGASYAAPATMTISATASDSDGSVTRVDFYAGSQMIGTDSSGPYAATWSNITAGVYTLTAVARDNSGATRTSNAVGITVGAVVPRVTTLVFSASTDHSSAAVTSYSAAIFRTGDPSTGTPRATRNLGKPNPVGGDISVDISSTVDPLPAGSYYVVVSAIGPGGSTASTPSGSFNK